MSNTSSARCSPVFGSIDERKERDPIVTPTAERLYVIAEVAEHLRVSEKTVLRWIRKGALQATRIGPHGLLRVTEAELQRQLVANSLGDI